MSADTPKGTDSSKHAALRTKRTPPSARKGNGVVKRAYSWKSNVKQPQGKSALDESHGVNSRHMLWSASAEQQA